MKVYSYITYIIYFDPIIVKEEWGGDEREKKKAGMSSWVSVWFEGGREGGRE
jgi:hypothetical protein